MSIYILGYIYPDLYLIKPKLGPLWLHDNNDCVLNVSGGRL